jgi:hypothetical protein
MAVTRSGRQSRLMRGEAGAGLGQFCAIKLGWAELETVPLWRSDGEGPNATVWGGLYYARPRAIALGEQRQKPLKIGNNDNKNGNSKNNGKDKNSKFGKLSYSIEVGESEGLTDGT